MATTVANRAGAAADHEGDRAAVPAREVDGQSPPSLHEKLALMIDEAQRLVEPTGETQQGKTVFSIGDVEKVVGMLCAKHKVTTRWSSVDLTSYEQATSTGSMRMWIASMSVIVTNAELVDESFTDPWIDIGTNPAAAASFCRKGYYKALLHLAEANDDAKGDVGQAGGGDHAKASAPRATTNNAPRGVGSMDRLPCEECAAAGLKNKKDYPPVFWPDSKTCDGGGMWNGKFTYVNHQRPVAEPHPESQEAFEARHVPQPALTGVGQAVQTFADGTPLPDEIPFFAPEAIVVKRRTRCRE